MKNLSVLAATAALGVASAGVAASRTGMVVQATAERLYLDAGSRAGIEPGMALEIRRRDGTVSTCRVERVSENHATCLGKARPGDTVVLPEPEPSATGGAPSTLPPPPSDEELEVRHRALETADHEKVEYRGPSRAPAPLSARSEVRLVHTTWASQQVGPWHQERLDVVVRGLPVAAGLALYADLSARRWSARSGAVSARPDEATQLYVWEAALARRGAPGEMALAFGRVRPWSAPGATIVDGAQAGWRTRGNWELGVFGGGVPDPETLAPSFQRATAGTYWVIQSAGSVDALVRYLRHEMRLAYATSPELGRRFEAEALEQISLGRIVDVGAGVRLAAGDHSSPGALDALRVDVGLRPVERFSLLGGFRYQGFSFPERDGPGAAAGGGPARHADLTMSWDASPAVTLSAVSGLATDLTTGVSRRFAGPELTLPRLFGAVGGASLGYLEEGGWSGGRSAWLQITTRRPGWLQVLVRTSWLQTRSLGPYAEDELGAFASIGAQLGPTTALRVSALARAGARPGTRPFGSQGTLLGGVVDASLSGRF